MSDQNTQVIPTNDPSTISPEQQALIDQRAQARADEIATQKTEALKQNLIESLSGKKSMYGEKGPESWDKLHETIETSAVEKAEKRIMEKLEAKEKEREQKEQLTVKQQEEKNKAEFARIDTEWAEAVKDGILPDISKDVKAKLSGGATYAQLTDEERNDPGLKAYNESKLMFIQMKQKGESSSFYRTAKLYSERKPAGAHAPVLGGTTQTATTQDYTYEEVQANRKKKFGY